MIKSNELTYFFNVYLKIMIIIMKKKINLTKRTRKKLKNKN